MTAERETNEILDPILRTFRRTLQLTLEAQLVDTYISGSAQMTEWGGRPYEGPPIRQAIDYAQSRGAQLVTQMDDVTRDRLARVVSEGIENRRGVPGIARDLRQEFGDMTRYRSQLIAKNETADALGQAFEDRGKDLGITGKEWVTVGDDRVSDGCIGNAATGVIPFDQPFPSGHMRPPRFPGCRCAAAPARVA